MKATFITMLFFGMLGITAHANPTESFRQTCQVQAENAYQIQAYCQDTYGNMIYNNFNRQGCVGDIANINGVLSCARATNGGGGNGGGDGGGHGGGWLPPGSYQQTCNSCYLNNGTLRCSCEDTRGYYHNTYLYTAQCRGDIANINGRLMCN